MSLAALIRAMGEAGATPAAIALAVEAIETERSKEVDRKAKRAAQKAKERSVSRDNDATVARQGSDSSATVAPPPPEVSPQEIITQPPILTPPVSDRRDGKLAEWTAKAKVFYANYPKKVEPRASDAKFIARCRAGVDPDRMIAGAARFAEAHRLAGTDKQYIPAPAVWLNRGGYDSEDLPEPKSVQQARAGPSPNGHPPKTNLRMEAIKQSQIDADNGLTIDIPGL